MQGQFSLEEGSLLPHVSCYTLAKLIQFFQTFRIRFSISRSLHLIRRISSGPTFFPDHESTLFFVVSFIFLGDIGETKLIREATLKNHISDSLRGVTILRYGLQSPWSQLHFASVKRL